MLRRNQIASAAAAQIAIQNHALYPGAA